MSTVQAAKLILVVAVFVLAMAPAAFAGEPGKAEYVDVGAGRFDLWRAHNDRMIVFFGTGVSFKRYSLVGMLNQVFTVASDVKDGVRYQLREHAGEKTLVID